MAVKFNFSHGGVHVEFDGVNTTISSNSWSPFSQVHVIQIRPPAPPVPDKKTIDDALQILKQNYRKRAKELHPDAGGSEEAMKQLNAEYEAAVKRIKAGNFRMR